MADAHEPEDLPGRGGGGRREAEDTAPGQRSPAVSGGWFGLRSATPPGSYHPADEPSWLADRSDDVVLPVLREATPPTGRKIVSAPAASQPGPNTRVRPRLAPPATEGPRERAAGAVSAPTGKPVNGKGRGRPRFEPGRQMPPERAAAPAWWRETDAPVSPQHGGTAEEGGPEQVRFLPPSSEVKEAAPEPGERPPPPAASEYEPDVTHGEHRLHAATVPLRIVVVALVFFATFGVALLEPGLGLGPDVVFGLTLVAGMVAAGYAVAAWQRTTFELRADHLVLHTGLFRRVAREIPLSRLQAVDVVRPLLIQVLGLAELRVELAGGDRGGARLRYLSLRSAQRLRAAVLGHAAGLSGQAPEAPEWRFYQLPFSRLLGALAFRIPVLSACVLFLALIGLGIAFGELGVLGGALPLLLGLMRGFLGPLLRFTDFRAALSPDGLRLRYGVLQTRMQTVPPGRVQAVRIVQPLLWRVLGMVRLEANVAGYAGERQMDSSTVLPVVPRALAFTLVDHLFPGTDSAQVRLEPAARSWSRHDALGMDETVFVSRRGWGCQVLEIVPHARAQCVRLAQGPIGRLLDVAAVVVDTTPGPVRAVAAGRDPMEARSVVEAIAARAHRARTGATGPERWVTRSDAEPPPGP